jgi:hypothetical protein
MREDEDQFRHYMPVLRRIIILLAVLTAIPVVMWTITAFVRTYVGRPEPPTFRSMTAATANTTIVQTAAPAADSAPASAPPTAVASNSSPPAADNGSASPPAAAETNATPPPDVDTSTANNASPAGTDANAAPPAVSGDAAPPADSGNSSTNPAAAGPANSGTAEGTPPAATTNTAMGFAAPPPAATDNTMQLAAQPPAATDWPAPPPAADASAPADPIVGPVPLPPRRPSNIVLAQGGVIPLPMPRPDAVGPSETPPPATPIDWLRNVFHAPATASDNSAPAADTDNAH